MSLLSRMRSCRSGAAAVEFAIVGLILVLVSIAIIDFGRALYVRHEMSYSVDKGAREVLIGQASSDTELEAAIRDAFAGPDPDLLDVSLGSEVVNGVTYRTVTLAYPLALILPGFTGTRIDLGIERRIPVS